MLQYFLVNRMFRTEQNSIKTRSLFLLNDVLTLDLTQLTMERYDILERKGINVDRQQNVDFLAS